MYKILISKSAIKQLSNIPVKEAIWLSKEINNLKQDPRPPGSIKLKGKNQNYRIRVGNYRAIYSIEDNILTIQVLIIAHRKDSY